MPMRFIIKQRRLSYLHHLLKRDKDELISKVFYAQKRKNSKNDWAETIRNDILTEITEQCSMLSNNTSVEYEDIFGEVKEQLKVTKLYCEVFETENVIETNQ